MICFTHSLSEWSDMIIIKNAIEACCIYIIANL